MNDEQLGAILRKAYAAMDELKGACPSADELVRYQEGRLDPAGASQIGKHLVRCSDCDLQVERLTRADESIADAGSARRVIAAFAAGRQNEAYWRAIAAGALAASLLLAYPLYRLARTPVPAPSVKIERIVLASLARAIIIPQARGTSAGPSVKIAGPESSIVVTFFVPMAEGGRYSATVVDSAGRPVFPPMDVSSEVQTGNVTMTVPAALVPVGPYCIRVTLAGQNDGPIALFPFEVLRE